MKKILRQSRFREKNFYCVYRIEHCCSTTLVSLDTLAQLWHGIVLLFRQNNLNRKPVVRDYCTKKSKGTNRPLTETAFLSLSIKREDVVPDTIRRCFFLLTTVGFICCRNNFRPSRRHLHTLCYCSFYIFTMQKDLRSQDLLADMQDKIRCMKTPKARSVIFRTSCQGLTITTFNIFFSPQKKKLRK